MSKGRGYSVLIKRSAEKEMDRLEGSTFKRVAQTILKLERESRPKGSKKLRGPHDDRLRVGEYRILDSIGDDARVVEVIAVGHRGDVYTGRVVKLRFFELAGAGRISER